VKWDVYVASRMWLGVAVRPANRLAVLTKGKDQVEQILSTISAQFWMIFLPIQLGPESFDHLESFSTHNSSRYGGGRLSWGSYDTGSHSQLPPN
jgi:hypothetical protein